MTTERTTRVVALATEGGDLAVAAMEAALVPQRERLKEQAEGCERTADVVILASIGRLFVRELIRQVESHGSEAALSYRHLSARLQEAVNPLTGPLVAELRREMARRAS